MSCYLEAPEAVDPLLQFTTKRIVEQKACCWRMYLKLYGLLE